MKNFDPWTVKTGSSPATDIPALSTSVNSSSGTSTSGYVTVTNAYNPWEAAFHSNTWLDMQTLQHHHNQVRITKSKELQIFSYHSLVDSLFFFFSCRGVPYLHA